MGSCRATKSWAPKELHARSWGGLEAGSAAAAPGVGWVIAEGLVWIHPQGFSLVSPECPDLSHLPSHLSLDARVHLRHFKQLAHHRSALDSQPPAISKEKSPPLLPCYLP